MGLTVRDSAEILTFPSGVRVEKGAGLLPETGLGDVYGTDCERGFAPADDEAVFRTATACLVPAFAGGFQPSGPGRAFCLGFEVEEDGRLLRCGTTPFGEVAATIASPQELTRLP